MKKIIATTSMALVSIQAMLLATEVLKDFEAQEKLKAEEALKEREDIHNE